MNNEDGFVLTLVLIVFLVIEVIGIGVLSMVMSDLHGAVAHQLAMQAVHTTEAGLNYGVAQLVSRASAAAPTDERYSGETEDMAVRAADGASVGTFRVTVRCLHPREAVPPACQDDVSTADVDEQHLRVIRSTGFVPARPGRARRQIEAIVRRYAVGPGDTPIHGVCGREGVELGPGTTITADVGSNGTVQIDGSRRGPASIRERLPKAPLLGPLVEAGNSTAQGLTGFYSWRVTFVDRWGEESGGSPPTRGLFLSGQLAHLTNIPAGEGSIVRRRVYRTSQGATRGPWFLVGEIQDNVTQEYTDHLSDEALRWRMPEGIEGNVTAGGAVVCSPGCANPVDGKVRSNVQEVVCPNFLPPPSHPGSDPAPNPIIQTAPIESIRWTSLHVRQNEEFTIQTLSTQNARLHIHLTDIVLERGATLAITGLATVYFHVSGTFTLGRDAVFGAIDFSGHLIRPSDRVQVFSSASDPSFLQTGAASVRWERDNKISALVFAPNANIVVDRGAAFSGTLYGKYIRLSRSTEFFLDPIEGLRSEKSDVRPSPFQYVVRWYDNPNPGP